MPGYWEGAPGLTRMLSVAPPYFVAAYVAQCRRAFVPSGPPYEVSSNQS